MKNNKKLLAYSFLSTTFLSVKDDVNAQVVYTDIDPDIVLDTDGETAGVDMNNDGSFDFAFLKTSATYTGYTFTYYLPATFYRQFIWGGPYIEDNSIAGYTFQLSEAGGVLYLPYALYYGTLINSTLSFQNPGYQSIAQITKATDGDVHHVRGKWYPEKIDHYFGVQFKADGECHRFGWIRCSVLDSCKQLIIKDYAYETKCNHGILAGDTVHYVATDEIQELHASVYSFNKNIFIKLEEEINNAEIHVFDIEGKLIYSENMMNTFTTIHMQNAIEGIYLVEIISDKNKYSKKVFIE